MQQEKTRWIVLELNRMNHDILYRKEKITYWVPPSILFILLLLIDPSQKATTIRINSVYLVEEELEFGVVVDDVFSNLGKYEITVNLVL